MSDGPSNPSSNSAQPNPSAGPTPRRRITHAEWLEEGERLFGPQMRAWRFVCPSCGHVQSAVDAMVRNPSVDLQFLRSRINFSCEGRWTPATGCDWTLGGLFQVHRLEVVTDDGDVVPTFEFDHSTGPALVPVAPTPAETSP